MIRWLFITLILLSTIGVSAQDGEEQFLLGTDFYFKGEYEKALHYLDSAIEQSPDDISRFFYRSKVNAKLRRYEAAIRDLTICIDKSEHDASYLNIRAGYYEELAMESKAIADYSQTISLKANWYAHFRRGMLTFKQGKLQEALSDFDNAIALNENQADPRRARALLRLELGDSSGACEDMWKVYDMGFDDVRTWISRNCR